jgi:hypothetical protein
MLSFLVFMATLGIGIYGVFLVIEFCEYLRKFQVTAYDGVTFEKPFGVAREDFLIHPIKPHKFMAYLFASGEERDQNVKAMKLKLKVVLGVFVVLFVATFFTP